MSVWMRERVMQKMNERRIPACLAKEVEDVREYFFSVKMIIEALTRLTAGSR